MNWRAILILIVWGFAAPDVKAGTSKGNHLESLTAMNPFAAGCEKPLLIAARQAARLDLTGVRHDRSRDVKKQNVAMTAIITLLTGRCTAQPVSLAPIGWIVKILAFERTFYKAVFDPYHPEQHYMRGPGPACAAKASARS